MTIRNKVRAYIGNVADEHRRYRSWEHCYAYFRRSAPAGFVANRDHAALQLGFYLASWGMYRGSSFLLSHGYTVHRGVIDVLGDPRFSLLWDREFGAEQADSTLVSSVLDLVSGIRAAYRPFGPPTDTLVTKVILGTYGCLPACDRYFLIGFKSAGFGYSSVNHNFVDRLLTFCQRNRSKLQAEQALIKSKTGVHYPLMKLVDMYFWQTGFEEGSARG